MSRIFTPSQLSLFSISKLAAWWEELQANNKFNQIFPKPTELEKRLQKEGEEHERILLAKFKGEGKTIADIKNLTKGNSQESNHNSKKTCYYKKKLQKCQR